MMKLIQSIQYSIGIIIILMLASCQANKVTHSNQSLYQQLGGRVVIEGVINKMVYRLHHDTKLSELFVDVNDKELKINLESFICHLTGGGCNYQGAEMIDVHTELFITKAEFDRFVSLFIYSMEDEKINFSAQNKLLSRLALLRDQIIEM